MAWTVTGKGNVITEKVCGKRWKDNKSIWK